MDENASSSNTTTDTTPGSTSTALALPTDVSDANLDADALPTIFSFRKPSDLKAGVSSGAKSVAKGVGLGVGALIGAPVLGAREGGLKGFAAGLGTGIIMGIALPVSGVVVGAVQVARGALNQPEAIAERSKGKIWDEDTRTWVAYNLQEDARALLGETEEEWCEKHGIKAEGSGGNKGGSSGSVKETELYDALGVESDASAAAIRKAYFKMAKELHPDKNRHDPNAHDKFQKVGEAYQVLSNDELRQKYDAQGKAALEHNSLVDPTSFFAMLFGSEPFEHLIGELKLATMFALGGEADEAYLKYKQRRREVLCAVTLGGMLSQYVHGDEEEFEADMHREAEALREAPVGVALIWTCGYIYEQKGLQALGGLSGLGSKYVTEAKHGGAHLMNVTNATIKMYRAFRKNAKEEEKAAKSAEKKKDGSEGAGGAETEGQPSPNGGGASSSSNGNNGGASSGAEEAAQAERPAVAVGMRVTIQHLVARPELNGSTGVVTSWNEEKERWVVEMDGDGDTLMLRPPNLQAEAAAKGGGGGQGGGGGGPSEDTVLLMLESMWRVSMLDIESTLRHACNKVLSDQSVDKDARKARAKGLVLMGRVFQAYGSADALKTTDFSQHMQQVGERMAAKVSEEAEKEAAKGH